MDRAQNSIRSNLVAHWNHLEGFEDAVPGSYPLAAVVISLGCSGLCFGILNSALADFKKPISDSK